GDTPSPFIEIEGEKWFRTGDIGYLDEDDTLVLTGRLKRFVKIGGEMVSLGSVEETLIQECSQRNLMKSDLPSLAILEDKEAKLIAFVSFEVEKEALNEMLRNAGFS